MRYVMGVPDDALHGARLVNAEDAEMLIVDLTNLLGKVGECDFCRLQLLADPILRADLFKAVVTLKVTIEDLEQEASL